MGNKSAKAYRTPVSTACIRCGKLKGGGGKGDFSAGGGVPIDPVPGYTRTYRNINSHKHL